MRAVDPFGSTVCAYVTVPPPPRVDGSPSVMRTPKVAVVDNCPMSDTDTQYVPPDTSTCRCVERLADVVAD